MCQALRVRQIAGRPLKISNATNLRSLCVCLIKSPLFHEVWTAQLFMFLQNCSWAVKTWISTSSASAEEVEIELRLGAEFEKFCHYFLQSLVNIVEFPKVTMHQCNFAHGHNLQTR